MSSDETRRLACPECAAPCFPSVSGLWVAGVVRPCPRCGARLMVGPSSDGCAEAQCIEENGVATMVKLRQDVARAWRISAEVSVRADEVEVSVESFQGTESQGFVARATVCGVKLSEVAVDRGEAMTKLVDAARARGQMERKR